jgi:hypothetical protein
MNAEFNWWLLIVGLVVGAGLVWLVIADWSRREEDVAEDERSAEAAWISDTLTERGEPVTPESAEDVLAMHRDYLRQTGVLDDLPPEPSDEVWPTDVTWIPGEPAAEASDGAPIATAEPGDLPGDELRDSVRSGSMSDRTGFGCGIHSCGC